MLLRLSQHRDLAVQRSREGVEFLPDGHRHGVLQLGASHLDDVDVLVALRAERVGQLLQLGDQLVVAQDERHLDRRRVGVVRRLRHVQVVVRLDDLVVALLVPGHLEGDVGQHFVGVHVGRRAGAALVPVDQELIVVLAVTHGLRGLLDGRQLFLFHGADVGVRRAAASFTMAQASTNPGIVVDRNSRDLEVLERAGRLHAVVGIRRNLLFSQEILFSSRRSGISSRLPTRLHRHVLRVLRSVHGGSGCRRRCFARCA